MRGAEGAAAAGRDDTVYWCLRRRGAGVSAVAAGICELLVQARARGRGQPVRSSPLTRGWDAGSAGSAGSAGENGVVENGVSFWWLGLTFWGFF